MTERAAVPETEIDALEAAAKKAIEGPWAYQEESDAYTHIVRRGVHPNIHGWVCSAGQDSSFQTEWTARYIAAASPDVILKLIAELRSLKAGWISVEQELPPIAEFVDVVWNGVVQNSPYMRFDDGWQPVDGDSDTAPAGTFSHWHQRPTAPGEAIAEGQPKVFDGKPSVSNDEMFQSHIETLERDCKEGRHTWVGGQDEVSHCDFCGVFEPQPEPWEIQCGAQDPDGWCCGLSTGHPGDHDFHASTWPDVFKPEPVAKASPIWEKVKK